MPSTRGFIPPFYHICIKLGPQQIKVHVKNVTQIAFYFNEMYSNFPR